MYIPVTVKLKNNIENNRKKIYKHETGKRRELASYTVNITV